MQEINFEFDSVTEFYTKANILTKDGNEELFEDMEKEEIRFRGLSISDILKYKYSYPPGLKELVEISDINVGNTGGSGFTTKWDEFDGDNLDMERLMEGNPALVLRKRTSGKKIGKFILINVNIEESAFVTAEELLWKTYTAAKLVESLEASNYRVQINIKSVGKRPGTFKGSVVDLYCITIPIKKYSQSISLSLLITTISPWFFRYWVFKFLHASFNTYGSLGTPGSITDMPEKETEEFIIDIDHGECLSKKASNLKIKEIEDLILNIKE